MLVGSAMRKWKKALFFRSLMVFSLPLISHKVQIGTLT
jgi:hypothetical protein